MPDGRPPDLPAEAPLELREFIECKRDSVTITQGDLTWLPLPPDIKEYAPTPTLGLEPGATAGTGTMTIGLGFATLSMPVSIVDGNLQIDAGGLSAIPGAQEAIDAWLKDFNDWLKRNGKRLKPTSIQGGSVTLTKEPIPVAPVVAPPPPAPPEPPVKPVTPVPPAAGGGIGGSCALFGLLGVLLIGAVGVAWVAGIIPGSGGGGGDSKPSSSTATVVKPSASTEPIAKPSTSTGPIAKPSTSTGPVVPADGLSDIEVVLLGYALSVSDAEIAAIERIFDPSNDMYFPTPGQVPAQYFAESDLRGASGFRTMLTAEEVALLNAAAACGGTGKLPDGTPFRMACNQDKPLVPGEYVIISTLYGGPYPAQFPSAGLHSWAVFTNPDNDLATGFTSSAPDNYLIGADTFLEMLAFTDASGAFKNYILGTRMADPVRSDTGQRQGNLPTTARVLWVDGVQVWIIPVADFGSNWNAGSFATLNRGQNSPANLAADAPLGPSDPFWRKFYGFPP